jgi:hypothetical protein
MSIRLDPDVRQAIEELAEEDGRSVSGYINRALRAHAEALGRLEAERLKGKRGKVKGEK